MISWSSLMAGDRLALVIAHGNLARKLLAVIISMHFLWIKLQL
jgi:hypothetical protein